MYGNATCVGLISSWRYMYGSLMVGGLWLPYELGTPGLSYEYGGGMGAWYGEAANGAAAWVGERT